MNQLITFSIEFLVLSVVFFLGYLVIKNHTIPTFRRFYLLAWMIFTVSFPMISFETQHLPEMNIGKVVAESNSMSVPNDELMELHDLQLPSDVSSNAIAAESTLPVDDGEEFIDWFSTLKVIYIIVSAFFLFRIIMGLSQIFRLKSKAKKLETYKGSVFEVNDPSFKGASFFNWVFIGKNVGEGKDVIIHHEKTHIKLGHSFDILLSHIYCSLFWINPFSWLLKKNVALNTEFEVDDHLVQFQNKEQYANILLSLSGETKESSVMNHFSAFHLRARIVALTKKVRHKKWVSLFSFAMIFGLFFIISCESVNSSEVMVERLNEVKTITTRFVSHQSDTQQKTGKVVAVASFAPDGSLEELIEQTTYPYDRSYEVKKAFWETPEKTGIPFVMDGLSLGDAEKSFLYGHDWPSAYFKHLYDKSKSRDLPWNEIVETDNEVIPSEITVRREMGQGQAFIGFGIGMPDVTEYFEYEGQKVVKTLSKSVYPEIDSTEIRKLRMTFDDVTTKKMKEKRAELLKNAGKKQQTSTYTYDGDLLTSIKWVDTERRFYYENGLMIKSEYLKAGEVINTRMHFYKNSLKDRTEIFNRYNEPEYTITYEYEFW